LAAGVAAIAVALALVLPAGTPGTPTFAQAAALAARGPAAPAPAITQQGGGTRLGESVDEVYFPDWHSDLGWRATGVRTDTLAGRRVVTVFYARGSKQLAYTIVATPPLPEPNAQSLRTERLTVRALNSAGRTTVTWRRGGVTCILSSTDIDARALATLAGWSD
jgi:hypothetical protein